jgi:hypothetical protein
MIPQGTLSKLEAVRSQTLDRLGPLSQRQLDARPPATESDQTWSLGEVFMHIATDEIYLRELISRPLREGMVPPAEITFLPPPPPYGISKEVILFWLARARSQTRTYVNEWPRVWNAGLRFEGGLQPMNALEWLEGYGGHEEFHHRQIDALIEWCTSEGIR